MDIFKIGKDQESHLRDDGIKFEAVSDVSFEELKIALNSLENPSDDIERKEDDLLNEERSSFPLEPVNDSEASQLRFILSGMITIIEEQNHELAVQRKEITLQKRNATIQRIVGIIFFMIFNFF